MKKFKIVIAAVFALCLVEGVWAISPGGALGGGGKAAQQHPQQEGARVSAPVESAGPSTTDIQQMETSAGNADAEIEPTTENQPKVAIGKTSTEGQAGNEFDDAGFAKVAAENDSKRESRKSLKDALKKYRESVKSKSPDSPLDDTEMILLILLAILLPPLAVYLFMNDISTEFWICLLLTLLLVWIGGVIYALYVILR